MPTRLLFILLALASLAACNEKPQNFQQSGDRVADRDQHARYDEQRQRTMGQDEAARIYGGMLR